MLTPEHMDHAHVWQVSAALRLADGVLLVVDCVEGVVSTTERLIRHVIGERLPIVLLINQIDRLILELKLPPQVSPPARSARAPDPGPRSSGRGGGGAPCSVRHVRSQCQHLH